jgi:hypothetical protein
MSLIIILFFALVELIEYDIIRFIGFDRRQSFFWFCDQDDIIVILIRII